MEEEAKGKSYLKQNYIEKQRGTNDANGGNIENRKPKSGFTEGN